MRTCSKIKNSYPDILRTGWRYIFPLVLGMILLPAFLARAQTDSVSDPSDHSGAGMLPAEEIYLQTDRSLYISGENIWYKVYCREKQSHLPTRISKAVYVELLSSGNEQVSAQIIRLNTGSGSNVMEIPGTLASGLYYIRAYTGWMKNSGPISYCHRVLKIYNPFLAGSGNAPVKDTVKNFLMNPALPEVGNRKDQGFESVGMVTCPDQAGWQKSRGIEAVTENLRSEYLIRDKVHVALQLKGASGEPLVSDLSVAVIMDDSEKPVGNHFDRNNAMFMVPESRALKTNSFPSPDSIFLPEPEELIISGSIKNSTSGNPESNRKVYFSWVGGNRDVRLTTTNAGGKFFFQLPEGIGNRQAVIQVPSVSDEIELKTMDQFTRPEEYLNPGAFDLSEYSKNFLEQVLLNYQVTVAYKLTEKRTRSSAPAFDFYDIPDEKHILDQYIKLPLMEEFFRELVKGTILTRENGSFKINVLDRNLNRIIGPEPGYLIDGVPVFNSSMILNTDPLVFRDIRVVSSRYLYRNIIMDGIVDLNSRSGNFSDFEMPPASERISIQLFEPEREYIAVRYDSAGSYENPKPDFRTLLLWKPDLSTRNDGRSNFEFTTSDVPGRYKIIISGFTISGQKIHIAKHFDVRDR